MRYPDSTKNTITNLCPISGGKNNPLEKNGRLQCTKKTPIAAKVLICHGADDPFVSKDEIAAFQQEMRDGKADWEMIYYANAVHSFTNPEAGNDNSKGAAYNAEADKRSWQAMKNFLAEIFGG